MNPTDTMNNWLLKQLSDILQFPVPQDMIEYIQSIENVRDLEDYMKTLLNFNDPQHTRFLQELLERRKGNVVGYKKADFEEVYMPSKVEPKKKKEKGKEKTQNTVANAEKKSILEQQPQHSQKKKTTFVNLYSKEGQNRDVVMLKGRHKCDCQASKHQLVNNCLKCGRVVCEQEGSGPCLFCGNLVCNRREQEVLSSGGKHSNQLMKQLMDQKPAGYDAAVAQRDRLLEYDRTSEKRTRVIDDESDYFSSGSVWLSPQERNKLKQREEESWAYKHQSRLDKPMSLDLGLRRLVEAEPSIDLYEMDDVLRDITESVNGNGERNFEADNMDPSANLQPKYDPSVLYEVERGSRRGLHRTSSSAAGKIQDREYLEMVDEGLCLSLHQPWASLLVNGIKQHEGRNWYSAHRGRLWIASASKVPSEQEVKDTEDIYSQLKGTKIFPLTYPTGCLLGCVNIMNCLPQEEYRQRYPDGESDSPFVFVCDNPLELPIRFPISGKHKIYKLDAGIHQAAQKAMQRIAKIKSEQNSQSFLRNS